MNASAWDNVGGRLANLESYRGCMYSLAEFGFAHFLNNAEGRPAGLLLLEFDASGNRAWLDPSNRLWPHVAGRGRRMGASTVLRKPSG